MSASAHLPTIQHPQVVIHQAPPQQAEPLQAQPALLPNGTFCPDTLSHIGDVRHFWHAGIIATIGCSLALYQLGHDRVFAHSTMRNPLPLDRLPWGLVGIAVIYAFISAMIIFAFPRFSRLFYSPYLKKAVLVPSTAPHVQPADGPPPSRVARMLRRPQGRFAILLSALVPLVVTGIVGAIIGSSLYPAHHVMYDYARHYKETHNFNHTTPHHLVVNNNVPQDVIALTTAPAAVEAQADAAALNMVLADPVSLTVNLAETETTPETAFAVLKSDKKRKGPRDRSTPEENKSSDASASAKRDRKHRAWDSDAWKHVDQDFATLYVSFMAAAAWTIILSFGVFILYLRQFRAFHQWQEMGCPTTPYPVGLEPTAQPVITYTVANLDSPFDSRNPPTVVHVAQQQPQPQPQQQPPTTQIVQPAVMPVHHAPQQQHYQTGYPVAAPPQQQQQQQYYVPPVIIQQAPPQQPSAPAQHGGYSQFIDQEHTPINPNIQQSYNTYLPVGTQGSVNGGYGGY